MELLPVLWVPDYSMDGGRLMTSLEAKRATKRREKEMVLVERLI